MGQAVGTHECVRKAEYMGIVLGVLGCPFLHESRQPWLVGQSAWQADAHIDSLFAHRQFGAADQRFWVLRRGAEGVVREPDAGEVRLAVRGPRCWSGQVGLSVSGPRN